MSQVTVRVNGLTLSHKGSGGWVRSTLPDVCKSPVSPVPYTNVAYSATLAKGTTTVRADGGHMISVKGSEYATSIGDEPGTGGGVISGVHMDRATWLSWSPNVFMEGRPVCRKTDKMLLNRGNTVSVGGDMERELAAGNVDDVICGIACTCMAIWKMGDPLPGYTLQGCFEQGVHANFYNGQYPRRDINPTLWAEVPFDRGNNWAMITAQPPNQDLPTSNYIRPNSRRLDLALVRDGRIETLYDIKFPGDPPLATSDPQRLRDYQAIAAKHDASLDEFIVEDRCPDCGSNELARKLFEGLAILLLLLLLRRLMPGDLPEGMPGPVGVPVA